MSIAPYTPGRISDRRARVDKLLTLKARIEDEINAIESEIAEELTAMRTARLAAAQARIKVGRRRVAECGTDGGYYRHRRTLGEDACSACKLAHRVAEAERQQRKRKVA